MKRKNKLILIGAGLMTVLFAATSCQTNFCSNKEKARIMFAHDSGVSKFYSFDDPIVSSLEQEKITYLYDNKVVQYVNAEESEKNTVNSTLAQVLGNGYKSGIYIPSNEFFIELDQITLDKAIIASETKPEDFSTEKLTQIYEEYGYLKFYSAEEDDLWSGYDQSVNQLRNKLGVDKCPSVDFVTYYKSGLQSIADRYRSCITIIPGKYGTYGDNKTGVYMDKTTWGYAWGQGGHLIEGLIVFPVAWMLDSFANLFAANGFDSYSTGVPQILSLLLVTVIVRLFIFLVTIKSTLSQQKMTSLQPELAKIQQKYPNANTNNSQKQRMAEEQMRLYKKNGVNPLSSLLVLIVQFPVFIGVWNAMTSSAVLSTGTFLNLDLSASIWECLQLGPNGHPGWWTALVLILLMSAGQFFSMKVPQWIQKARTKKVSRLTKNPAEKQQNRTANIVSYVMLIMIIFMGFTLPAAMGVYWFIGALVSLLQTLIMNLVTNRKRK